MVYRAVLSILTVFAVTGFAVAQTSASDFVDADGDGISDRTSDQHRDRTKVMQKVRKNQQTHQQKLTREQKRALKKLTDQLKKSGATRKQIQHVTRNRLRELGVQPKAPWADAIKQLTTQQRLTEEQKKQLSTLINEMRTGGSSGADIKNAVDTQMREWTGGGSGSPTGETGTGGSGSGGGSGNGSGEQ